MCHSVNHNKKLPGVSSFLFYRKCIFIITVCTDGRAYQEDLLASLSYWFLRIFQRNRNRNSSIRSIQENPSA